MSKFVRKPKQPKALWTRTFPDQAARLHPERGMAGGIKARSVPEEVRMAIYRPIAAMFKQLHPECEICSVLNPYNEPNPTEDVHHTFGREGLLLFDVRKFKSACRACHNWVKDNPKAASEKKLDFTHKGKI